MNNGVRSPVRIAPQLQQWQLHFLAKRAPLCGAGVVVQIESAMEQAETPESIPFEALRAILDPTGPPTATITSPGAAQATPAPAPTPAAEPTNPAIGALLRVLEEQGQGVEAYRWATVKGLLGRYLDSEEAFQGHTLVSGSTQWERKKSSHNTFGCAPGVHLVEWTHTLKHGDNSTLL